MSNRNKHALLEGVRVLDCGQFIPGPYVALICADMGADVVKVEPPAGDPLRLLGPLIEGSPLYYQTINSGKTIIELDLKSESGVVQFRDLVSRSDVLIESFRPGAFERIGLGNKSLSNLNPRLVHLSLTGYGATGPFRNRSGHDLNYAAVAGVLAVTGLSERPIMTMPPIADFAGALQAALTISAALFRRERTGQGTYIDIGMCDVLLSWQMISLIDQWQSAQPELRGRCALNGGAAFYNIYPTKDRRFITLAALEEKFWRNFCLAVGHAEWISRRQEPLPQELLIGELKEFFSQRTLDYWIELLDKVDCCFEPVADLTDLFENHQLISRKMVTRPKHKFGVTQVNFPAWIDGQPPELRTDLKYDKIENVIARWNGRGL